MTKLFDLYGSPGEGAHTVYLGTWPADTATDAIEKCAKAHGMPFDTFTDKMGVSAFESDLVAEYVRAAVQVLSETPFCGVRGSAKSKSILLASSLTAKLFAEAILEEHLR